MAERRPQLFVLTPFGSASIVCSSFNCFLLNNTYTGKRCLVNTAHRYRLLSDYLTRLSAGPNAREIAPDRCSRTVSEATRSLEGSCSLAWNASESGRIQTLFYFIIFVNGKPDSVAESEMRMGSIASNNRTALNNAPIQFASLLANREIKCKSDGE